MKEAVLLKRIEQMRKQLNDCTAQAKSLTDPEVVALSQQMDKLLVKAQQMKIEGESFSMYFNRKEAWYHPMLFGLQTLFKVHTGNR